MLLTLLGSIISPCAEEEQASNSDFVSSYIYKIALNIAVYTFCTQRRTGGIPMIYDIRHSIESVVSNACHSVRDSH